MGCEMVPTRLVIGVMIFSSVCINYMMRVNLSINIVAMVPVTTNTTNVQNTLNWSASQRANILSSYFWGYLVANVLAGTASERWGPRLIVASTTMASAVLTLLSPLASKHSYLLMLILRILLGFLAGFVYPSVHVLVAHWAVPTEKGKFIGAIIGGTIGTVVVWTVCGLIIEALGWEWGFYIFGILSFLWSIMWLYLVYDTPKQHPRISLNEMKYLSEGIKNQQVRKQMPPYRKILTSVPVWSLLCLTFSTGWGIYFVLTLAPTYIANVLGYKMSSTGLLSASLYLSRSISAFLFGSLGDFLLKRNILSVRATRKVGCLVSHALPGCLLLALTHDSNTPKSSMAILILAMLLNGAVTITSIAIPHDLTNNFAGTVTGIATSISTVAGILVPILVAQLTKSDETSAEAWKPVFYIGAAVYVLFAVQFIIFGSTTKQSWNDLERLYDQEDAISKRSQVIYK